MKILHETAIFFCYIFKTNYLKLDSMLGDMHVTWIAELKLATV